MKISMPPCVTIHAWSIESIGINATSTLFSTTSGAWPTANLAIFIPFRATSNFVATKMFAASGSGVNGTGKIDVGIYTADGTLIVSSGSVIQTNAVSLQEFDITDTAIAPGLYYLAVSLDNTANTLYRISGTVPGTRSLGLLQQASAHPLPASATYATMASTIYPLIGLTTRTLV